MDRTGLTTAQAADELRRRGPNRLPEHPPPSRLALLARQFGNAMVALLALAAVVSLAAGDPLDAAVIAVIVALNAGLGFVQEGRAEAAAREVRKLLAPRARVVRDGAVVEIDAEEVVPGDLVVLTGGDRVPADGRFVDAVRLELDESLLTGESLPVSKETRGSDDRSSAGFAGTTVSRGSGRLLVTATGERTEVGRIVESAERARVRTPLQVRLDRFAAQLLRAVAVVCVALAAVAWAQGAPLRESFLTGVALAVAAVPEGLPAVVTIVLALGMRRLARSGAIVRRLPAVETLGSATVICTDKTGTLTLNRLALDRVHVCGVGDVDAVDPAAAAVLAPALLAADPGDEGAPADSIERALTEAAAGAGVTRREALAGGRIARFEPFDAERRRTSVVVERDGPATAYVKGAPEALLPLLADRAAGTSCATAAERWAADGARVLMVAVREGLPAEGDPESELEPVGLVRLADSPRETSAASVSEARAAGIRTLMVTGDHPATARAIARATGIVLEHESDRVLTGEDIERMTDAELDAELREVNVYARVSPGQKLRLVGLLKAAGEVVAMTGDGVNDVPALRAAHIGVAMGRAGSDAASAAADLVLTDDNYGTIVRAIRTGRAIFDDIRHFTLFLLAANLGEVIVFAIAVGAGLSAPLTVVQILAVNLLTDGPPAVALGADPPEAAVMRRPPRRLGSGILDGLSSRLAVGGVAVGAAAFASFLVGRGEGLAAGRTSAFTTLVAAQLLFVYSARGAAPFWRAGRNPALHAAVLASAVIGAVVVGVPAARRLFDTVALSPVELACALAFALVPFAAAELHKAIRLRRSAR